MCAGHHVCWLRSCNYHMVIGKCLRRCSFQSKPYPQEHELLITTCRAGHTLNPQVPIPIHWHIHTCTHAQNTSFSNFQLCFEESVKGSWAVREKGKENRIRVGEKVHTANHNKQNLWVERAAVWATWEAGPRHPASVKSALLGAARRQDTEFSGSDRPGVEQRVSDRVLLPSVHKYCVGNDCRSIMKCGQEHLSKTSLLALLLFMSPVLSWQVTLWPSGQPVCGVEEAAPYWPGVGGTRCRCWGRTTVQWWFSYPAAFQG